MYTFTLNPEMKRFGVKERLLARLNLLPLPIYDVFAAPLLGHTIAIAIRLNLFENLIQPRTSEQIAEKLLIHPEASSLLLSTLSIAGYVTEKEKYFSLSNSGKKWLLKSSPSYLGNFVRYVELLYKHWLYLDETVQHGQPPTTYFESFGGKEWEVYVYGMMDLARIIFPHISKKLSLPKNSKQLIDLGGSHGWYSMQLCKRNPQLRATIVDLPQALKWTQKIVQDYKDTMTLLPGNMLEMSFGTTTHDVALAFNVVHGFTWEQNIRMLERISQALRPNGYCYILDQFRQRRGSRTDQFIPLMVGINLMNEVGGNVYEVDEVCEWLTRVGFKKIKKYWLFLPGVSLLRAEK